MVAASRSNRCWEFARCIVSGKSAVGERSVAGGVSQITEFSSVRNTERFDDLKKLCNCVSVLADVLASACFN